MTVGTALLWGSQPDVEARNTVKLNLRHRLPVWLATAVTSPRLLFWTDATRQSHPAKVKLQKSNRDENCMFPLLKVLFMEALWGVSACLFLWAAAGSWQCVLTPVNVVCACNYRASEAARGQQVSRRVCIGSKPVKIITQAPLSQIRLTTLCLTLGPHLRRACTSRQRNTYAQRRRRLVWGEQTDKHLCALCRQDQHMCPKSGGCNGAQLNILSIHH